MHAACMCSFPVVLWIAASGASAQGILPPNGHCLRPALSADGRFLVFDSEATNLCARDTHLSLDVYLFDCVTREITLVSATPEGTAGNGPSLHASISSDGSLIVFASDATDLVPGAASRHTELYLYRRGEDLVRRVPIAGAGRAPDGESRNPRISADGRFIVFDSIAANLVEGDTNGAYDVFVHEIASGRTQRVSVGTGGSECSVGGLEGSISGDGRLVAFTSLSPDAAPGDDNGQHDVFLHDRATGQTRLLSVGRSGGSASGPSGSPILSADGSIVLFTSAAPDLTADELGFGRHLFFSDVRSGHTKCLTTAALGSPRPVDVHTPSVSSDGARVLFSAADQGLSERSLEERVAIFLLEAPDYVPSVLSVAPDGRLANQHSGYPCISLDGSVAAYSTRASNIAGATLSSATVCIVDLASREIAVVAPPN